MTLIYMFIDGALHLEDVSHLHEDKVYHEMIGQMKLPSADAIGDWLRRYGSKESERWIWEVTRPVLMATVNNSKKKRSAESIDTLDEEITAGDGAFSSKDKSTDYESIDYASLLGGDMLDIDATIIQSEKGDALKSYKGIKGYQPMLGIISENGMITGSDFSPGQCFSTDRTD